MNLILFILVYSSIFDHTVPHLFDTIDEHQKYNPNIYNYDLIHKEFEIEKCLNTNQHRSAECLKYSMKKYYNPFSLITTNNKGNSFFPLIEESTKKSTNTTINETQCQNFWLECGLKGNEKCIELFETFNFFEIDSPSEKLEFHLKNSKQNTIFSQLRESHDIMYKIGKYSHTNIQEKENEKERENRFQKAYEILKPIAFLAFEKYITDHFGSLRPLRRINRSLVETTLGYNTAYKHELKILLNGTDIEKDPSWLFGDIYFPEVAKLLNDIVNRRKYGPDSPLNEIYSKLLRARFPYLFEDGFKKKDKYKIVKSHLHRGYEISESDPGVISVISEFGDFYIGSDLYQSENADDYLTYEYNDEDYDDEDDEIDNEDEIVNNDEINNDKINNDKIDNNDEINNNKIDNSEINNDENLINNEKLDYNNENGNVKNNNVNNGDESLVKSAKTINDDIEKQNVNEEEKEQKNSIDDDVKSYIQYLKYVKEQEMNEYFANEEEFNDYDDNNEDEKSITYVFYHLDEKKNHHFFYDYYFDGSDEMDNGIFIEKETKDSYQELIRQLFRSEDNYFETADMRLEECFDLCKNYLREIKDIEDFNQSNLTAKIATIYGIEKLFNKGYRQNLINAKIYNTYVNSELTRCKFVDEGLYYLIVAAKHGEVRAIEALLFKFFLLMNETNDTKEIDSYFDLVLDEFSDFYDPNKTKSNPPNIYVHYHDLFSPIVSDFFDSIIFFDKKLRKYFQVDQIIDFNTTYKIDESTTEEENEEEKNSIIKSDYLYKNPRNWTYEDAAKALRRFIDSSFLVQSGHLAEYSLSCQSAYISFRNNVDRYFSYFEYLDDIACYIVNKVRKFMSAVMHFNISNDQMQINRNDDDEFIINDKRINKRSYIYALRVYQTLALSGNRDAMWNAHILMKKIDKSNQHFLMFITDSNETVFLHELDVFHRRFQTINKTEILDQLKEEEEKKFDDQKFDKRSIRSYFNYAFNYFSDLLSDNSKKSKIIDQKDYIFYEEISDYDPYAAFSLAWKKRENLTAAFELLDKTEKMKPEAKVAVVIYKMIITTLSFINSVFTRNAIVSSNSLYADSSKNSTNNVFNGIFNSQKYERIGEIIKSTPYLPEVLLGLLILSVLAFYIYIRISLYID